MNGYVVEKDNRYMKENEMEFFLMKFPTLQTTVNPHIHGSVEMLFIVKGVFKIISEGREFEAFEGEMFLFRSQAVHSVFATEADSKYYVLKIKPSLILSLSSPKNGTIYSLMLSLALSNNTSKIQWSEKECRESGITELFERMASKTKSNAYGLDILYRTCIGEILLIVLNEIKEQVPSYANIYKNEDSFVRKLYDVIAYINKHYSEDITLEQCSQKLFVSYSYFSRKFKEITGKSFRSYLTQVRINHAEKLLLSTSKPITDIATECGFNSITYFSSMYKNIKGITPSQARAKRDYSHQ